MDELKANYKNKHIVVSNQNNNIKKLRILSNYTQKYENILKYIHFHIIVPNSVKYINIHNYKSFIFEPTNNSLNHSKTTGEGINKEFEHEIDHDYLRKQFYNCMNRPNIIFRHFLSHNCKFFKNIFLLENIFAIYMNYPTNINACKKCIILKNFKKILILARDITEKYDGEILIIFRNVFNIHLSFVKKHDILLLCNVYTINIYYYTDNSSKLTINKLLKNNTLHIFYFHYSNSHLTHIAKLVYSYYEEYYCAVKNNLYKTIYKICFF